MLVMIDSGYEIIGHPAEKWAGVKYVKSVGSFVKALIGQKWDFPLFWTIRKLNSSDNNRLFPITRIMCCLVLLTELFHILPKTGE